MIELLYVTWKVLEHIQFTFENTKFWEQVTQEFYTYFVKFNCKC